MGKGFGGKSFLREDGRTCSVRGKKRTGAAYQFQTRPIANTGRSVVVAGFLPFDLRSRA